MWLAVVGTELAKETLDMQVPRCNPKPPIAFTLRQASILMR